MKHRLLYSFATAIGLLFGATTYAADSGDIALYLTPDTTTHAFLQVPASDARLAAAQAAANGWETVSLPGPFTAYVPSNRTHKDLTVIPGTPIHAFASSSSAVLGVAPENPPLSLVSPDVDWSTVSFAGPVTVYFHKAAPVATAPAPTPVVVTPAPTVSPKPSAVTALPVASVVTATPTATASATDVPHYYYGVLKLRTNPALGGPINAQYLLYSDKGALVALVDLNNVVLGRPIAEYLGKPVKLYGTAYSASNLPSVVINAQMLETTN